MFSIIFPGLVSSFSVCCSGILFEESFLDWQCLAFALSHGIGFFLFGNHCDIHVESSRPLVLELRECLVQATAS